LREIHDLTITVGIDAAKAALRHEDFDVIISNVFHTGWNVFDFLREMKCNPMLRGIPIIYFCSRRGRFANIANNALKSVFRELGAIGFVAVEEFYVGDNFAQTEMERRFESLICAGHQSGLTVPCRTD